MLLLSFSLRFLTLLRCLLAYRLRHSLVPPPVFIRSVGLLQGIHHEFLESWLEGLNQLVSLLVRLGLLEFEGFNQAMRLKVRELVMERFFALAPRGCQPLIASSA